MGDDELTEKVYAALVAKHGFILRAEDESEAVSAEAMLTVRYGKDCFVRSAFVYDKVLRRSYYEVSVVGVAR